MHAARTRLLLLAGGAGLLSGAYPHEVSALQARSADQETARASSQQDAARLTEPPLMETVPAEETPTLSDEEQNDLMNALAAAIALADSLNAIIELALEAQMAGLGGEEVAFAFGIAQTLTPDTVLIEEAFNAFQSSASDVSTQNSAAAEVLNAAFNSGTQAAIDPASQGDDANAGSASMRPAPFGAAGFQGGSPGGGGASPR